ncbi:RNA-binding cell elongation regulator Jag/EloR [Lactiplantibacillus herbarum]|uniref:RNA-binding cell elongation regulator Jag/EloR n=1 Tax=Lactiplantibacillus herbarum TaxID=1670446 RepID=UPI00064E9049|nr:RNA-binding cell elongation regulator Jag/EloR [Lactiplantibacillus herbarum]
MTVFKGDTVEAAIAAGLQQMSLTREQVEIEVVAEAKKGFLGLGKQVAQVQLTAVPTSETLSADKQAPISQDQATPSSNAGASIEADAQMDRGSQPSHAGSVEPQAATNAHVRPAVTPAKPGIDSNGTSSAPVAAATTSERERTPEEIAARQAANEQAVRDLCEYMLAVVKELGVTADLDVDFGNRYANLNFDTAKQGLLIGKHGRTINALQDLAQVYMNHHGASHVNVVLDVDDYRDRREATLARLAESTARDVVASGKQVFLDPMPSFERKLIHAELANNHHVSTFSEGREPPRAVVVAIRK